MSKSLRQSEIWFNRGLWVISFIFASFLIGLGNIIVRDLPKAEQNLSIENFVDQNTSTLLKNKIQTEQEKKIPLLEEKNKINKQLNDHQIKKQKLTESYQNWLSARSTTERSDENPEVLARAKQIDHMNEEELLIRSQYDQVVIKEIPIQKEISKLQEELKVLNNQAYRDYEKSIESQNIRVFLYRLCFTLPLLLISAWLFLKKRKNAYWPFVWGFIFFSLFAFFVELVPYLPSYGGYIRYIVGIILTFVIGHYAIKALQNYLERIKLQETLPQEERKKETANYDTILMRLSKRACPNCERGVDLTDPERNFCPHCGLGIFNRCKQCNTRKSTFDHFCFQCGTNSQQ